MQNEYKPTKVELSKNQKWRILESNLYEQVDFSSKITTKFEVFDTETKGDQAHSTFYWETIKEEYKSNIENGDKVTFDSEKSDDNVTFLKIKTKNGDTVTEKTVQLEKKKLEPVYDPYNPQGVYDPYMNPNGQQFNNQPIQMQPLEPLPEQQPSIFDKFVNFFK